jgi:hypothetical protein
MVVFARPCAIINFKLEKHRGSQATGVILCDRRARSLARDVLRKPRQKSTRCFHCFLARYHPDNSDYDISWWWNRCGCFLRQEHADIVACLGALRPRRHFSIASFGTGGVDGGERCCLCGSGASHHETGVASQSRHQIPGTPPQPDSPQSSALSRNNATFCCLLRFIGHKGDDEHSPANPTNGFQYKRRRE